MFCGCCLCHDLEFRLKEIQLNCWKVVCGVCVVCVVCGGCVWCVWVVCGVCVYLSYDIFAVHLIIVMFFSNNK